MPVRWRCARPAHAERRPPPGARRARRLRGSDRRAVRLRAHAVASAHRSWRRAGTAAGAGSARAEGGGAPAARCGRRTGGRGRAGAPPAERGAGAARGDRRRAAAVVRAAVGSGGRKRAQGGGEEGAGGRDVHERVSRPLLNPPRPRGPLPPGPAGAAAAGRTVPPSVQMTKPFQGLGSRYHTHLCSLDHAVRSNRPFVSLDGGWIFTEPADCPNSNDDCYFNKFTGCPQRFCTQARDGEQKCARPAPPPATQQCGATCLCGDCGVKDDKHELVWARHSCNDLRDAPLPEGANRSHLWWTAQALFFMLQPGAALNAELERDIRSFPAFAHPVINMHVRRGRLKQPEMARFFALDEYTKVAEPFVRRLGLARPRAFIQTNEPAVITETRSFPKWQWGYTEWNRTGMDLQIHNDPRKVKRRKARGWWTDARKWTMHSLRNLWLMVRSDYWVCTFSSNWCRLALRLAYATYGRLPPTISLDAWGFDPYTWYKNAYVRQVAIALGEDWP
eukprot:TRINITY_DN36435_c0_g1_i2.p1 TRINITY_DN36435_c0_g1~~TRINITY_DN36435_c0_g1_i2.p1  ORF type:complete len:523 (+),score=56.06 TRINITY_DN36435_c0_g1_i2:56-1570(+)